MKNKQFFSIMSIMVCLAFSPGVNHASIIGMYQDTVGGFCPSPYSAVEINVIFGCGPTGTCDDGSIRLFDGIFFTPPDAGDHATLTSSDDPEFSEVVEILTNGVNDNIYLEVNGYPDGCGDGTGSSEDVLFFPGTDDVDFVDYTITGITLRMDELTLAGTDFSVTYTIIVEGEYDTSDSDGDGIFDGTDNCPTTPNSDQLDSDFDGAGDDCDVCPNDPTNDLSDGDGICDDVDNCMGTVNPDQNDIDDDGTGDACDTDNDNDGDPDETDCAPLDPTVYNGASELCNNIDDNCNEQVDETVLQIFSQDADDDGFGNPEITTETCSPPAGYVVDNTDCDDSDASVNLGAAEVCGDSIDQDCDGSDKTCSEATQEIIDDVVEIVELGDLDDNNENKLVKVLLDAINQINNGNDNAAIDKLNNFVGKTERLIMSGKIDPVEGNDLMAAAQAILDQLLNP
jgi:hypothetical protein